MHEKYKQFGKSEVFRNRTLLTEFLIEYKLFFKPNESLNPSCSSCRTKIWNNYLININKKPMEKKDIKCKYRLKKKYNGIIFESNPVRNGEMTDEKAKELLLWHPAHELLFDVLPEEVEVIEVVDNVSEIVVKKIPKKEEKILPKRKKRTPKAKK